MRAADSSPAARHLYSHRVIAARPAFRGAPLQETIDAAFEAACVAEAWAQGVRAAKALQVGDVFTGCNPASIAFYGSTPDASAMPMRAQLEHMAFRSGYLAALPQVWTGATAEIVLLRRAAPRTRGNDRGGFVVVEQVERGVWRPVHVGSIVIYATLGAAEDAARYRPARTR